MITVRRGHERGHADHGWLDSHHTFSFADYYDPRFVGFSDLRVINEDRVAPGAGFGTHPHRDMEIVSYVLEGGLQHRDSMGSGSVIRPGDVQLMSAGTGVTHSEFNASTTERVHFLQIWILPAERGTTPRYAEANFAESERRGRLRLLVSPDGRDGSLVIGQDACILGSLLGREESVRHVLGAGRSAWVQVARGAVLLGEHRLEAGDGAAVTGADAVELRGASDDVAELLLFDLRGVRTA